MKRPRVSQANLEMPLSLNQSVQIAGYAHERLSLCYEKGYGVKLDPSRSAKHFKLAVERGNSNALVTLAKQQIASGKFTEALANYQRAAAEDSSVASYMLGQIYYFGTHTEKNLNLALKYSYQSARRSNADALYFLAYLSSNNVARRAHSRRSDSVHPAGREHRTCQSYGTARETRTSAQKKNLSTRRHRQSALVLKPPARAGPIIISLSA